MLWLLTIAGSNRVYRPKAAHGTFQPAYVALNASGELLLDAHGVALRGLLVRHLILPQGIAASERVFHFIAEEISVETYLNVMDQYRPCYRAADYPQLDRPLARKEFQQALGLAHRMGLTRLDHEDRG